MAVGYDFNHPIENPRAFEKYRDALIQKCRAFTGFDADRPTLDDNFNPLFAVIPAISVRHKDESFSVNRKRIQRALYFAKSEDLQKIYQLKTTKNVNCHDMPDDQGL